MSLTSADYRSIVAHYEECLRRYGDSHRGVDWPNAVDVRLRNRIMLGLLGRDAPEGTTLLDFGCGAGQLVEHLRADPVLSERVCYTGLDLSPLFVSLCRRKFPDLEFLEMDVLRDPSALPEFDYAILNGVFTERREVPWDDMFDYLRDVLVRVFPRVRRGFAFNVMSKQVDWERDDLFHVPMDRLARLLTTDVSRHFSFQHHYGLYEYTAYVYRQPANGS